MQIIKMNGAGKQHTNKTNSARAVLALRVMALMVLVCMFIFVFRLPEGSSVRAAPVPQEGTPGYEVPTYDPPGDGGSGGYNPPPTNGPPQQETPFVNPTAVVPSLEPTLAETSTPVMDAFRTEDAQMNGSQSTRVATETTAPTITPYPTATKLTKTPRATPTPLKAKKKGGFTPDWGLFWIGFSVPVLGACGVVLYLLDRRPDIFRRQK